MADEDQESKEGSDDTDYFATYLADLDPDHTPILTGDMVTTKGMLLLKKGAEIKPEVANYAVQHQLKEPLDQLVFIENGLDAPELFQNCIALCEDFPDLEQVVNDHEFQPKLKKLIENSNIPSQLYQYMTILRDRLPQIFEKSIFCTIIGTMVAEQLGLNDVDKRDVLIAGIAHDIGYLHLPPEIVDSTDSLTNHQWNKLKRHVHIGHQKLLKLPNITGNCARAVQEHHERCDGAGYPQGKNRNQLSQVGQIIALGDSLQAIRMDQFGESGRNLANARPYLQLNSDTHGYELFQAIDQLLSTSTVKAVSINPFDTTTAFAKSLSTRNNALAGLMPALDAINKIVPNMRPGPYGEVLINITRSLGEMLYSSGLLSEELGTWISGASETENDASVEELDKMQLMQNELSYQLGVVTRNFSDFMSKECAKMGPSRAKLRKSLDQLEACNNAIRGIKEEESAIEENAEGESGQAIEEGATAEEAPPAEEDEAT